ncbi:recombinase family protein [Roseibium sp.]|uniref:recombinase family protein n=1 Tax=Roseibium sp. TaxID=1936156 RepID=UPI003BAD7D1D
MRRILYARVSTTDQSLEHQRQQAISAGFEIDETVADHGVSGVSTRLLERPEGRRLFDLLRSGDELIVRWVDRLGRNYEDVTDTIREFMRRGVVVRTVINKMKFDGATQDPMQAAVRDSLIAFMAAMAQAESEVKKAAQRAGIDAAKTIDGNYLGRKPSYNKSQLDNVVDMLKRNVSVVKIADEVGLSRQTIYRIKSAPEAAYKALHCWEDKQTE